MLVPGPIMRAGANHQYVLSKGHPPRSMKGLPPEDMLGKLSHHPLLPAVGPWWDQGVWYDILQELQ
jgi:hypothetical protein